MLHEGCDACLKRMLQGISLGESHTNFCRQLRQSNTLSQGLFGSFAGSNVDNRRHSKQTFVGLNRIQTNFDGKLAAVLADSE